MLIKSIFECPSDADGGGGGDDDGGGFPTTLPAWPRPRGYHAQGSNIPFGESLTDGISMRLQPRPNATY